MVFEGGHVVRTEEHDPIITVAVKYKSVRTDFGTNVVVFPDRLSADAGDLLEVIDSQARLAQRLPK